MLKRTSLKIWTPFELWAGGLGLFEPCDVVCFECGCLCGRVFELGPSLISLGCQDRNSVTTDVFQCNIITVLPQSILTCVFGIVVIGNAEPIIGPVTT